MENIAALNMRRPDDSDGVLPSTSANLAHGFMVTILNPKILLFNAAFLPQFFSTGGFLVGAAIGLALSRRTF